MKGIIWIKTTCNGLGYFPGFEAYIKKFINFIGDEQIQYHNKLNFKVLDNKLYYKNLKVDISKYSHIMMLYCAELLTKEITEELLNIEEFAKKNNLYVYNPISLAKNDYDKLEFFKTLNKRFLPVPKYYIVDDSTIANIPFNYPFLLRTNADWGGNNLFFIENIEELFSSYESLRSKSFINSYHDNKIIAVEYYSPYIEELGYNLSCRINMIGPNIVAVVCDPFPITTWTGRFNRVTNKPIDLSKLENILLINQKNPSSVLIESTKYLLNFLDSRVEFFKFVQQTIGLHCIGIDFIISNGEVILLECNSKMGITPYKVDLFISYSTNLLSANSESFNYYSIYKDDEIRNKKILEGLLYYPRNKIYFNLPNDMQNLNYLSEVNKLVYANSDIIFISSQVDSEKKLKDKGLYYTDILTSSPENNIYDLVDFNSIKISSLPFVPTLNTIKLSNIFNGYQVIKNAGEYIPEITIFVVTILGNQLKYAIDSINSLKTQKSILVHFIVNVNPTSLAYEKMNNLCKTKYFIQMDEDMILFDNFDEFVDEAIIELKSPTIFNVCFKLKDDLLGIGDNRTLYGIKVFNSVIMKNIKYHKGISSVDRELNYRMEQRGMRYKLSSTIAGYHAKYRDQFEIMLKYAKMTSGLLLNNIQASVIDSIRIFTVIGSMDISVFNEFLKIACEKWGVDVPDNFSTLFNNLVDFYNKVDLGKHVNYGFNKVNIQHYEVNTIEKGSRVKNRELNKLKAVYKNKSSNINIKGSITNISNNVYYGIFGIIYSLVIGFRYDYEYYPIKEYNLIKK